MYAENPPATGSRLASAAKVSASGNDSRHRSTQATIDAGPAVSAATAGRTRIPVPSTAPVYRATAVRRPMVRSSSTFIRRVSHNVLRSLLDQLRTFRADQRRPSSVAGTGPPSVVLA